MVGSRGPRKCHGPKGTQRLYVIDTQTGRIERTRTLLPGLARFWLTTTEQNEVVLIATRKRAPWYLVALFEPEQLGEKSRARLSGLAVRPGRLIGAPRVSAGTLLLPVARLSASWRPHHPSSYYVATHPIEPLRRSILGRCFRDQPER
jgi:hypothetical protein